MKHQRTEHRQNPYRVAVADRRKDIPDNNCGETAATIILFCSAALLALAVQVLT